MSIVLLWDHVTFILLKKFLRLEDAMFATRLHGKALMKFILVVNLNGTNK
jgi:hypothetical protein